MAKVSEITLKSPAFADGGDIPEKYTRSGGNISPPLQWSGVPQTARSLVLIVDDPDAPSREPFVHWIAYNLPAQATSLPENPPMGRSLPENIREGMNSYDHNGYDGPAPPPGRAHHYRFTLAALDEPVKLRPGAERREVERAISGHVLARGQLVGRYGR